MDDKLVVVVECKLRAHVRMWMCWHAPLPHRNPDLASFELPLHCSFEKLKSCWLLVDDRKRRKENSKKSKQQKQKKGSTEEENQKNKDVWLTLLKASFLAAWLFVDRDDATTTRPSLLGRGLVWDRPAPAVLFGLVLPDGVLLLSTVSVDDDTVALISEDEVGVTVGSALAAVSLSPIEDWTTCWK